MNEPHYSNADLIMSITVMFGFGFNRAELFCCRHFNVGKRLFVQVDSSNSISTANGAMQSQFMNIVQICIWDWSETLIGQRFRFVYAGTLDVSLLTGFSNKYTLWKVCNSIYVIRLLIVAECYVYSFLCITYIHCASLALWRWNFPNMNRSE